MDRFRALFRALLSCYAFDFASAVCSSSCMELFLFEFDVSRLSCDKTAIACQCKFQLLDITMCAVAHDSNSTSTYELSVFKVSSSSNGYTAACISSLSNPAPCSLEGISDKGFVIKPIEFLIAALQIALELFTCYQMYKQILPMIIECEFSSTNESHTPTTECLHCHKTRALHFEIRGKYFCMFESPMKWEMVAPLAVSAFIVGKLFPVHYPYFCETRQCNKLAHNAIMTLSTYPIEVLELGFMSFIRFDHVMRFAPGLGCRARCMRLLPTISKSGAAAVSCTWITMELLTLINSTPGQRILVLGGFATGLSFCLVLRETCDLLRFSCLHCKYELGLPEERSAERPDAEVGLAVAAELAGAWATAHTNL